MALITDCDFLNQDVEIIIDPDAQTIQLTVSGLLSHDGVLGSAVYSFLKEEWKSDDDLIKYVFPMIPIMEESFLIGTSSKDHGWNWADTLTRQLLRTVGWAEVSASGIILNEYAGIVSLGEIQEPSLCYYQQVESGVTTDFTYSGQINEAIRIYSHESEDDFDFRSYLKVFCREQGHTYADSDMAEIGAAVLTYRAYRFPLTTIHDTNITTTDIQVSSTEDWVPDMAPYSGMNITYFDTPQSIDIGGVEHLFGVIVDGAGATLDEIYQFIHFSLRSTIDINAATPPIVIGETADVLAIFLGDTLRTLFVDNTAGGGGGVYISNTALSDINNLQFTDNNEVVVSYPFSSFLSLNMSTALIADTDAVYEVYFTNDDAGDNAGNDFNTETAIIVRTSSNFTSASRERTSNISTIETDSAHGLSIGDKVEIVGMSGTGYNDIARVVSTPTSTTFTYNNTGANEGNIADTGGTIHKLMSGKVNGQSTVLLAYDFDNNIQRGAASEGVAAPVTIVSTGLQTAGYKMTEATIERTTLNQIIIDSLDDPGYIE